MRRALIVLLVLLGVLLYWWQTPTPTPAKKFLPQSTQSAPTSKPKNTLPRRQITMQEIMVASGDGYANDPEGALSLEGQVLDEADKPVEGARVGISSNPARISTTNKDGRFSFDKLLERTYYLSANKGELYGDTLAPATKDEIPITIRVYTGRALEVTVLDNLTRQPIANAQIAWGDFLPREEATNADGKAMLRGLGPWGGFWVFADKYSPQGFMAQTNALPGSLAKQTVTLSPGASVSGIVLDPDDKPVSMARIFVETDSNVLYRDEAHKVFSDAQGRWSIPALEAGAYLFGGRHETFAEGTSEQVILDGKTPKADVIIRLQPAAVLTGKVVDRTGAGIAGAQVAAVEEGMRSSQRSAFTDERGDFRIEGLHLSRALVGALSDGRNATPMNVDLTSGSASVTLTLDVDGEISGIVVDTHGAPIEEATVDAIPFDYLSDRSRWSMMTPMQTRTDPDGRFTLKGVAEGAVYRLSAQFPKMREKANIEDVIKAKSGDKQVKIVMQALGGFKGKLQFEDGTTPKTFTVGSYAEGPSTFTDTNGVFTVNEVTPCKQLAYFSGPDFQDKRSQPMEVLPGEIFDLGVIIVSKGKTIKGIVLADGKPVEGATVVASTFIGGDGGKLDPEDEFNQKERALTKADGTFIITGRPEDSDLNVVAEHPTKGRSETKSVPKGKGDVTLELMLGAGGTVEGKITYAGKPVEAQLAAFLTTGEGQFSTFSGPDGKYQFTQLAPGDYELGAFYIVEAQFSGQQPARKIVPLHIEAGKSQKVNIDIPAGIDVTVNPTKNGATANNAAIQWVSKSITAKDTRELQAIVEQLPKSQSIKGYLIVRIVGGEPKPVLFKDVPAGAYTLCAWQMPSEDEKMTMSDEEREAPRPVVCQPQEILATPKEQRFEIALP